MDLSKFRSFHLYPSAGHFINKPKASFPWHPCRADGYHPATTILAGVTEEHTFIKVDWPSTAPRSSKMLFYKEQFQETSPILQTFK